MPTPQPPYTGQTVGGNYAGMPQTSYPNTTVVYQVPSMQQRPLSASGMSQQQQALPAKREKKVLQIVDPNTGKDIMSDVITHRQTPPGGQSSRGQTPNEQVEVCS